MDEHTYCIQTKNGFRPTFSMNKTMPLCKAQLADTATGHFVALRDEPTGTVK